MREVFSVMCQGCQVVPIHKVGDDIDSPFIWNSARHSSIDFSRGGKIWNVLFYVSHQSYSYSVVLAASRRFYDHTLIYLLILTCGLTSSHKPDVYSHIHSCSWPHVWTRMVDNSFPTPSSRSDCSQMGDSLYQHICTVSTPFFLLCLTVERIFSLLWDVKSSHKTGKMKITAVSSQKVRFLVKLVNLKTDTKLCYWY